MGWWWLAMCGAAATAGTVDDPASKAVGTWNGSLDAGGARVRVVVHVEAGDGGLRGTLDSPDQGATGLALDAVTATPTGLSFAVPIAHARYQGSWTDAGDLSGTWTQGPASLPLALSRGAAPPPPRRPQDPVPPLPYAEVELGVDVGPGVHLAGTLTVPPGPGKHAAVVLVTGSGAQDRDEALMGHRPFRVLADALTRAGVVVYRYDDRGVGGSTGDFVGATTRDFVGDATAAVKAVAARPEVDPARVGILGHSEGGLVATLAAEPASAAFVVLLAGPGVSGEEVVLAQVEALNRAAGEGDAAVAAKRAAEEQVLDAVLAGATTEDVRRTLRGLGMPEDAVAAQSAALTTPWYRAFLALDPRPALQALRVPVLAVVGDKDTQVVASVNAPALTAALANDPDATVRVLPGLNHLLQPATTGLPAEYGTIETTIDPSALKLVTDWVAKR